MQDRRLKNEREMKKKDDEKNDIASRIKKMIEHKQELEKLREKHLQETKEKRDELMDQRIEALLSNQEEGEELPIEEEVS